MQLQQKQGEISLLKRSIKEKQLETKERFGEVIALRKENRNLQIRLKEQDIKIIELEKIWKHNKHAAIFEVQNSPIHENHYKSTFAFPTAHSQILSRLTMAEQTCAKQQQQFAEEKNRWAAEKSTVVNYQRLLQSNYERMHEYAKALEQKVETLTRQLQHVDVNETPQDVNLKYSDEETKDFYYSLEV